MQPLLSVNQAASLLGVSSWTIRAYLRERRLTPVRLGRRVLFQEKELERFVHENGGATASRVVPATGAVANQEAS